MSDDKLDHCHDTRAETARQIAMRASAIHDAVALMATDALPQMIWSALPNGYCDYYNMPWYSFTGARPGTTDGDRWLRLIHADDREDCWSSWQHSISTGEPFEANYRLRRCDGEYRWVCVNAKPVYGNAEAIIRWVGTCVDVHQSRLCTEQNSLLAKEMDHRIANLFAIVGSLMSLEAHHASSAEQLAISMQSRLTSLNAAHQLVRGSTVLDNGPAASVHSIIKTVVKAYENGEETRFSLSGPNQPVDDGALTAIALLIHELCTNAAKYGALTTERGTVSINTDVEESSFKLHWVERGGRALAEPPTTSGFGTALIRGTVEQQLRGSIDRTWTSEGISVQLTLPLTALQHDPSAVIGES